MSSGTLIEERAVEIPTQGIGLRGDLAVPEGARGIVLFAHGSGSGRHSPRNRWVAEELRRRHLGTLLLDLLTVDEEEIDSRTRHLRFDIALLSRRLVSAAEWLARGASTERLAIGCFGASTGAAAALVCAARLPDLVGAVVSRGGRPDLAHQALAAVQAPTLLIVGGADHEVICLNEMALRELSCPKRIEIVPGATHLFEEPGALEHVGRLAGEWFAHHLPRFRIRARATRASADT